MLKLTLPDGTVTLVDEADRMLLGGFAWRLLNTNGKRYVHAWNGRMHVYMHRLVAGAGPRDQVDHRNGNGLDNRRLNLRLATPSQNLANRGRQRNNMTSQFKGVYWDKARSRWMATIHVDRKTRSLGRYADEEAAARAYDQAAIAAWGEFARLNFPAVSAVIPMSDMIGGTITEVTSDETGLQVTVIRPMPGDATAR